MRELLKIARSKTGEEGGVAFIMTLILLGVVGVLVAAFLTTSQATTSIAHRQLDQKRAFWAAEAGIEHLKSMNFDPDGSSGGADLEDVKLNKGGTYTLLDSEGEVVEYDQDNNTIDLEIEEGEIFVSEGEYVENGEAVASERIEINLNFSSPYDFPLFEDLIFANNITLKDTGDDLGAIGHGSGIKYTDSYDIDFDDFDGNENDVEHVNELPEPIDDDEIPNDYIDDLDEINSPGDYRINDVKISGNTTQEIELDDEGTVHLFVDGDFSIDGNAELIAGADTTLVIHTFDQDEITLNGTTGGEGNIFFYGPETEFEFKGDAYYSTAIIADEVTLQGNQQIEYPVDSDLPDDLDDKLLALELEFENWRIAN